MIVTLIFAGANCLENKMATSSVEEKQLVVEGMICGLSSDELKNLADHLEIPVMQYVGKSKLLISKLVRDKLYEEVRDRSTEADTILHSACSICSSRTLVVARMYYSPFRALHLQLACS